MKKISIAFLSTLFLIVFVSGCKKDEHKNYSTLVKTSPTVKIEGVPSSIIVREDTADVIATISVSLSEPQIVDIHVPISQIDGDAEQDADYELSTTELVFPAYTTGPQTFTVTILDDDIPEADETFKLQIGNDKVANATITPVTMDVTITNATSMDLDMSFNWSKNYLLHYWTNYGDTTVNTKNATDVDFYVFDSLGSLGDGSGSDQGIYDAATGRVPEVLTLNDGNMADGDVFVLSANLYTNLFRVLGYGEALMPQGPFPITTQFSRKGVVSPAVSLVQPDADAFTTNTEDMQNDGATIFVDLFKVRKTANMYIIYKLDNSVFLNGRRAHTNGNGKVFHKNPTLPLIYRPK